MIYQMGDYMEQTGYETAFRQFAADRESARFAAFTNRSGRKLSLLCRKLTETDYEEVRAFELEIAAGIPGNDVENIYQAFDEPGLHRALGTGWAVGLYDHGRLAAFLYVIPHPRPDHNVLLDVWEELIEQSTESILRSAMDPDDVMIADCILVRQAYRGFGLQRALFYLADCMARQEGISRLCGTASPKNAHSIRNFEAAGYRCVAVKPKYRSERCFFVKEVER